MLLVSEPTGILVAVANAPTLPSRSIRAEPLLTLKPNNAAASSQMSLSFSGVKAVDWFWIIDETYGLILEVSV
jgi:hypothetical protein